MVSTPLTKRRIGRSELIVTPLAFGGNVFGWTADKRATFDLLDRCVAAGIDLIDTADSYSAWVPGHVGGESETLIGEWLAARGGRHRIVLATKCGQPMAGEGGLSRAYIMKAVDRSLARLKTDYIDLYQAHRDDPNTPIDETLGAFADLKRMGKIRVIGASNFSASRLAASLAVSARLGLPRYECLQPHYNLVTRREFEAALGSLCEREQIGVIPYFALAAGFLTGKYRKAGDLQGVARGARLGDFLTERNLELLKVMDEIAASKRATLAQIALGWLMSKNITAPIASATRVTQLDEQLGALQLNLDATELATLDTASA